MDKTSFLFGLIEDVIHGIAFSKDNRKTIGVGQIQTILPFFQEEKDKWFSYLKEMKNN